jgi:hypothetical protein
MIQAIRDAGFTPVPDEVLLTVTGRLEASQDRFLLTLDRMTEPRTLTCAGARAGDALERALAKRAGRVVEILGRWRFGGEGRLQVETVGSPPEGP